MTAHPKYAIGQRVRVEVPGIVTPGVVCARSVEPDTRIWYYTVALDDGQQTILYESYLSPEQFYVAYFIFHLIRGG